MGSECILKRRGRVSHFIVEDDYLAEKKNKSKSKGSKKKSMKINMVPNRRLIREVDWVNNTEVQQFM